MNKVNELNVVVGQYNVKIICITETHLSPEIKDCEIILENFEVYRLDRKNGQKGGDLAFIFTSLLMENLSKILMHLIQLGLT